MFDDFGDRTQTDPFLEHLSPVVRLTVIFAFWFVGTLFWWMKTRGSVEEELQGTSAKQARQWRSFAPWFGAAVTLAFAIFFIRSYIDLLR